MTPTGVSCRLITVPAKQINGKDPKIMATETKDINWLTEQVNDKCGTELAARDIRIVIRKLVKDGTIERGEGRYAFTGLKDDRVVAVIKAVKSGATDEAKKERLSSLKKSKAADDEAPAKPSRKRKAAAAEPEDDEEAPKPSRRRKDTGDVTPPKRRRAKKVEVEDDEDVDLDEI